MLSHAGRLLDFAQTDSLTTGSLEIAGATGSSFGTRWRKTRPIRSILASSFLGLIGLLTAGSFAPAQAGPPRPRILIVSGFDPYAATAAGVLSGELTTAGNTVTISPFGVPPAIPGYRQIYDTRYGNNPPFTVGEMNQYWAFLNAAPGNALFLMGENAGLNMRNTAINQFIALAGGGTIAAPATNSANSETVNSPFTGPTPISTVTFAACGLVTSSGTGAFASHESGGGCSLFFDQHTLQNAPNGALVVVYNVNFVATAPTPDAVNEIAFRQNLEHFASAPPIAPPSAVPSLTTWGMILLALALCGFGVAVISRHASVAPRVDANLS
jgi:hypothetical protein